MFSGFQGATTKMHQLSGYAHCEKFMKKLPQHFDHSQFIIKVAGIERHPDKWENKQNNKISDKIEHSICTV